MDLQKIYPSTNLLLLLLIYHSPYLKECSFIVLEEAADYSRYMMTI